jgi:hypothetical protein
MTPISRALRTWRRCRRANIARHAFLPLTPLLAGGGKGLVATRRSVASMQNLHWPQGQSRQRPPTTAHRASVAIGEPMPPLSKFRLRRGSNACAVRRRCSAHQPRVLFAWLFLLRDSEQLQTKADLFLSLRMALFRRVLQGGVSCRHIACWIQLRALVDVLMAEVN